MITLVEHTFVYIRKESLSGTNRGTIEATRTGKYSTVSIGKLEIFLLYSKIQSSINLYITCFKPPNTINS